MEIVRICFYRRDNTWPSWLVWLWQSLLGDKHADITHVCIKLSGGEVIDMRLGVCYLGMPVNDKPHDYEMVLTTPHNLADLMAKALAYHRKFGTMSMRNYRQVNCVTLTRYVLTLPLELTTPAELYRYANRECERHLRRTDYRGRGTDTTPGYVTATEWAEDSRYTSRSNGDIPLP